MLHKKNQSQENHNMNKKRKKNPNTEINQILELSVKNHKTAIIKVFQQAVTNSLETNEKMVNPRKINGSYKKRNKWKL